jgi:hypothetical protein
MLPPFGDGVLAFFDAGYLNDILLPLFIIIKREQMSANRLSMRKIREVLRLKWANNLSDRKIAQSCNISRHAVTRHKTEQARIITEVSAPMQQPAGAKRRGMALKT